VTIQPSAVTHPCVLVVDDDVDLLDSMREFLELKGYPVVTAADGVEGLTRAREQAPCVILLDLTMPRMNGWEFRQAQRADPVLGRIPTVVLTAARVGAAELAQLGIEECLRKPIDVDRMLTVVGRYC